MAFDLETAATVTTAAVAVASFIVGGLRIVWNSIAKKFDLLRDHIDTVHNNHEDKDQGRHEDNLKRFGKIDVALAHLGWRNGDVK